MNYLMIEKIGAALMQQVRANDFFKVNNVFGRCWFLLMIFCAAIGLSAFELSAFGLPMTVAGAAEKKLNKTTEKKPRKKKVKKPRELASGTNKIGAPRSLDPELKIELFVEHPQIVTPTGLDIDLDGRVFAIESNTHFRPDGYKGHKTDRVWIFEDTNNDGKANKRTLFTDGLVHGMSVAIRPIWLERTSLAKKNRAAKKNGAAKKSVFKTIDLKTGKPLATAPKATPKLSVYIATRRDIFLYHDDNGDFKADRREHVVHLETKGVYPHNALAGITFDAMGWMYFGFGENLGFSYKLIGSDGKNYSGGNEGGTSYRCRPDGSELTHWTTGYWNPHASCHDAFGRLFTVDNDPGGSPPCRLLHVIKGGDYGYRYRNGRKGTHPFTAWDGKLPGTLGMMDGTGESPCGVVSYESDGLPAKYFGKLLVPSWGDHRIDLFEPKERGATFQAHVKTIIRGGENFRPVGLATAPNGDLYCTDWVDRSYQLHGKGRIWRISRKKSALKKVIDPRDLRKKSAKQLFEYLSHPRLVIRRFSARLLASDKKNYPQLLQILNDVSLKTPLQKRARVECLWALANVPVETHDFKFLQRPNDLDGFALQFDEVEAAALGLHGESQFQKPYSKKYVDGFYQLLTALKKKPSKKISPQQIQRVLLQRVLYEQNRFSPKSQLHIDALEANDSFLFCALINTFPLSSVTADDVAKVLRGTLPKLNSPAARERCQLLYLLGARKKFPRDVRLVKLTLISPLASVRRLGVQWAAEENLKSLKADVNAIFGGKVMTRKLFIATLAAVDLLNGNSPANFEKKQLGQVNQVVEKMLKDKKSSAVVRLQAVRFLPVTSSAWTEPLLRELLASGNQKLRQETVYLLCQLSKPFATKLLIKIATDKKMPVTLRADAIAGLSSRWATPSVAGSVWKTIFTTMSGLQKTLQLEAVRSAGGELLKTADGQKQQAVILQQLAAAVKKDRQALSENGSHRALGEQLLLAILDAKKPVPALLADVQKERPKSLDDWYKLLSTKNGQPTGDAAAGRRIFYKVGSVSCYQCHTVHGRGAHVGPDLSTIARTMNRRKLAESILEPSREISPQFTTWSFLMFSGKAHSGILLRSAVKDYYMLGKVDGTVIKILIAGVEEKRPQKKSLMPENLAERLTVAELRDLLAFLETLK